MLTSKHNAQEVIDAGHPPVAAGKVLIDWDGVIQKFGMMYEGEPQTGVVDAIRELRARGYSIIIFTSRLSKTWHDAEGWDHDKACAEQIAYMQSFCDKWGIVADGFTAEKVPAEAYFDDKAFNAEGDFGLTIAVNTFFHRVAMARRR